MNQLLRTDNCIDECFEKYAGTVYRVAYVYLKNKQDAEDIFQDVFLKLFEKTPNFESDEHQKAWLIRTTTNACKNHLRSAWFRKSVPSDNIIIADTKDDTNSIIEEVLALPAKYANVIYLHYFEGYKTEEIAKMLGESSATVRTRMRRGRERLKVELT